MGGPLRSVAVLLVGLSLYGCSATIPAPIHDDSTSLLGSSRFYQVLPGDTLYSIAFETGHDYRQLADWNGIGRPYRIVVGERLRLTPSQENAQPRHLRAPETHLYHRATHGRPLTSQGPLVGQPLSIPQPLASPQTHIKPRGAPLKSLRTPLQKIKSWIWPAHGSVEDEFGNGSSNGRPGNKGIDIMGHYGAPIRAAAAGRVVYVGSGLPGYGKLIIIKHNNDYLSAYAHNAQIDVKEEAMVQQGQIIATMGDSGTDRVELDFEIRKRGIPVNPIRYLPPTHHEYQR